MDKISIYFVMLLIISSNATTLLGQSVLEDICIHATTEILLEYLILVTRR